MNKGYLNSFRFSFSIEDQGFEGYCKIELCSPTSRSFDPIHDIFQQNEHCRLEKLDEIKKSKDVY